MRKIFLILMFCCTGAWNAYAADGIEAGGGIGIVDLGNSSNTWIAYVMGELPITAGLEDSGIDSSIVARLGTTGTSSRSVGAVTVDTSLDYFLSGLFKAAYKVSSELSAYAMLGLTIGSRSYTVNNLLFPVPVSGTDTSFSWGIGGDYHVDDRLKVGIDFTSYLSNVTAFAVNVTYKF